MNSPHHLIYHMDWNQHPAEVHAFQEINIHLFRTSIFEEGRCGPLQEIPPISIKHRKMSFQTPEDVEIQGDLMK